MTCSVKGNHVELHVLFKYLASFVKREWNVKDYPIRMTHPVGHYDPLPRDLTIVPWHVQIVRWGQMFGTGATKQAALADLQLKLETYKQQYRTLPRPGTHVPLQFAPTDHIDQYEPIARDYLRRILNKDYDHCFISDESSLLDFFSDEDYVEKTRQIYGVDISDIADGNLVQIFKRLRQSQAGG